MPEKGDTRKTREAIHAGIFYPEDPVLLARAVETLLSQASGGTEASTAIFSPHASIEYAGDLAGLAWKATLGREVSRIVIIAPRHRATEPAISLPESLGFDSPLGTLEVDSGSIGDLMDCGTFYEVNDIPHLEEHGIEVQLPFARHLHPGAKIVPILVGRTTMAVVKSLATGLRLVFGKTRAKTLFVVSSDLAFAPTPAESARLSDRFVDLLLRASWQELVEEELGVCGAACAAALFAGGIVEEARLLGRHGGGGERENADDAYGEYAAFAMR